MLDVERLSCGQIVPPRVQNVLQNLQILYGKNLKITSINAQEVVFSVIHMTDAHLISTLMTQKEMIFGSDVAISGAGCLLGPPDFQVLCEQFSTAGSSQGLLLRYLPNIPNRSEYLSGFWFY